MNAATEPKTHSVRSTPAAGASAVNWEAVRRDFPILDQRCVRDGKKLVYLDNAATTLKPSVVVDAMSQHYLFGASNVHRGVHCLSEEATELYEASREKVQTFLNARESAEIIFTSGTTASINLVARSYGSLFKPGDEVVISYMEHHSNIVPWQMLAERQGIVLKVAPIDDRGDLILPELEKLVTPRTRLISIVAVSNALGTVNPLADIVGIARRHGAKVLFDAAQAVAHLPVDVQALDCDFLAFSGHKIFGPTGIGVLYGKRELLEAMPPVSGGGDMIRTVSFEKTTYAELPTRHEAGTPHIAGVIGLGAALDYVGGIGLANIAAREDEVLAYGTERLSRIPGLRLVGTAKKKAGVLGFTLEGIHPHDIGTLLDEEGVAIRAGHHCAQPVMERFGVPATARASLSFYNRESDIDALVAAIEKAQRLFA
jgi:cysteine desulfurase/selenocysteine lyase